MKIIKPLIFCFIISSFIESSFIALASPKEELAKTQKDMETAKTRVATLAAQDRKIEDELRKLKEKLVQSAADVEKTEADLATVEDKLHILNDQLQTKNAALKTKRKDLASLLQAAMSLSRTPPEAMVMLPGDAMETMQAARALKMVSEAVKKESESIAQQIAELEDIKQKVTTEHDELSRKQDTLKKEREAIDTQINQRTALQAKLGREQEEEAQKLAALAKKADDLEGLVESLQPKNAWKNPGHHTDTAGDDGEPQGGSFAEAMGHMQQPANGHVVQWFGGHGNAPTNKGIIIATRPHTQVVAPFKGEVVYAGLFLNYGQIVIIRHRDDFHTLLAGLAKINVAPGEFLLEGEPIGAMGEDESGNRLYVELRKSNQPVDPAPWINGFNRSH